MFRAASNSFDVLRNNFRAVPGCGPTCGREGEIMEISNEPKSSKIRVMIWQKRRPKIGKKKFSNTSSRLRFQDSGNGKKNCSESLLDVTLAIFNGHVRRKRRSRNEGVFTIYSSLNKNLLRKKAAVRMSRRASVRFEDGRIHSSEPFPSYQPEPFQDRIPTNEV